MFTDIIINDNKKFQMTSLVLMSSTSTQTIKNGKEEPITGKALTARDIKGEPDLIWKLRKLKQQAGPCLY